jgi:hypothetical protein
MLRTLVQSATGQPYSVKDIRAIQKKLKEIQPQLRTQFMREVKALGKAPEQAIKRAIPNEAPLSGMTALGTTIKWGESKKGKGGAKSTTIRFRTAMGGKSLTTSLLSIRVNSAATSVADMAGRSRRYVGAGYRGTGFSKPIVRRYADGGQSVEFRRRATKKNGLSFINNLNMALSNRPSRMAWKAVEKDLPRISKDVQYVVDKWAIRASKGF